MRDLLSAGSPLLEDLLSPALFRQLKSLANQKHYSDRQLIHSRGDKNQGLSILVSGSVRVGNIGHDGSYITTSSFGAGQCYGEFTLFAGLPRTHDVTASGDTVIDEIGKTKFLAFFNDEPQVAQALLTIALVRSHSLLEFLDDFRRLPLETRVAKAIYQASFKVASVLQEPSAELEVRQEELAFAFGVSRVSMGKALKKLEAQKLINLGYGRIEVDSLESLEHWLQERTLVSPLVAQANLF